MTILRKRQESNGKVWFRVRRTWGETKRKETDVRDKKRDKKRARKRRGTREAQKKMEDAFARSIGEVSVYAR